MDVQDSSRAVVSNTWALETVCSMAAKDRSEGIWPWKIIASIIYSESMKEKYIAMLVMRRISANKRKPSSTNRRFWYRKRSIVRQIADMTATVNKAIEEALKSY